MSEDSSCRATPGPGCARLDHVGAGCARPAVVEPAPGQGREGAMRGPGARAEAFRAGLRVDLEHELFAGS